MQSYNQNHSSLPHFTPHGQRSRLFATFRDLTLLTLSRACSQSRIIIPPIRRSVIAWRTHPPHHLPLLCAAMEMEQEQERPPPPAYAHHEPKSLQLPSVPTHALPLSSNAPNSNRLPGIKSLDLPHATVSARTQAVEPSPHSALDARQWGKLPPISHSTFPRVPEGPYRNSNEVLDVSSPVDTASVVSGGEGHSRRGTSVVSVDDPDVRAAAEALSGLGNPGMSARGSYGGYITTRSLLPLRTALTWSRFCSLSQLALRHRHRHPPPCYDHRRA
jgi:hypothetical protein